MLDGVFAHGELPYGSLTPACLRVGQQREQRALGRLGLLLQRLLRPLEGGALLRHCFGDLPWRKAQTHRRLKTAVTLGSLAACACAPVCKVETVPRRTLTAFARVPTRVGGGGRSLSRVFAPTNAAATLAAAGIVGAADLAESGVKLGVAPIWVSAPISSRVDVRLSTLARSSAVSVRVAACA
eukprot:6873089-Prymnesium_polylepis.1